MYQKMYSVLVPVPLPIPVPILVPTSKDSYENITKQMQKIRDRLPNNAFEAEMLELAGVDIFDQLDEEDLPPDLKKPRFDDVHDDVENDLPQKVADNSSKKT